MKSQVGVCSRVSCMDFNELLSTVSWQWGTHIWLYKSHQDPQYSNAQTTKHLCLLFVDLASNYSLFYQISKLNQENQDWSKYYLQTPVGHGPKTLLLWTGLQSGAGEGNHFAPFKSTVNECQSLQHQSVSFQIAANLYVYRLMWNLPTTLLLVNKM